MNRAPLAGLIALACLAGCATKQQTASGPFWQEPSLPHPELLSTADTAYSAADAARDWQAIQAPPTAAEKAEEAAAVAKREHQQAQLTAIAAECRYEIDAHPGPAYRASHAYGLGGAIAGVFVEAAVNGAIQKQHFAECVQARALAVDAGLAP